MVVRFQIVLSAPEAKALDRWAALQMREPRDQARFILHKAMREQGFMTEGGKPAVTDDHVSETRDASHSDE